MNKAELIGSVAEKRECPKGRKKAVNAVFASIEEALAKGDKVQLVGFGTFEVRKGQPVQVATTQTGEEIQIAASRVPAFRAGKALKDSVS